LSRIFPFDRFHLTAHVAPETKFANRELANHPIGPIKGAANGGPRSVFRIAHSAWPVPPLPSPSPSCKSDLAKDDRRELSTPRKRSAEPENTKRRLEWRSVKSPANAARSGNVGDTRRLEAEVRALRAENEKLEEKLRVRTHHLLFFSSFLSISSTDLFLFSSLFFLSLYRDLSSI